MSVLDAFIHDPLVEWEDEKRKRVLSLIVINGLGKRPDDFYRNATLATLAMPPTKLLIHAGSRK